MTSVSGRPALRAGSWVLNRAYHSPVLPSRRPLTRSPVTVPSRITAAATRRSIVSRAASALDCSWIGPPNGLYSRTFSNTFTSTPRACSASAAVSPPMPPPATSTFSGRRSGPSPPAPANLFLKHSPPAQQPTTAEAKVVAQTAVI